MRAVILLSALLIAPPVAAQTPCPYPGRPMHITWRGSASALQVAWQIEPGATPLRSTLIVGTLAGSHDIAEVVVDWPQTWTTLALAPGSYCLHVLASDACGTTGSEDVRTSPASWGAPSPMVINEFGGFVELLNTGTQHEWRAAVGGLQRDWWLPPASGPAPASYVVEAGSVSGHWNLGVYDTGLPVLQVLVSSVPPGLYYVRVAGRSASGTGPYSREIVIGIP